MRKYYVNYYKDFANTYHLCYADGETELPEGWKQITRAKAEELARDEARREKEDQAFSGRADTYIVPYSLLCAEDPFAADQAVYAAKYRTMRSKWHLSGRVVEHD